MYRKGFGVDVTFEDCSLSYLRCQGCDLRFFQPASPGDELLYRQLQQFDWYYQESKFEFDIARNLLPPKGSVLEVGAGTGAFARNSCITDYTGLDLSSDAISIASEHGTRILRETIEQHSRSVKKYDAVLSFQVLEHVEKPGAFLDACVKCINPGGLLVIAVPDHDGFIGKAINNTLNLPPHHVSHWSRYTLKALPNFLGVKLVDIYLEPISKAQKPWATKVLTQYAMNRFINRAPRLIDQRIISRLTSILATSVNPFSSRFLNVPSGHSAVAVYQKIDA